MIAEGEQQPRVAEHDQFAGEALVGPADRWQHDLMEKRSSGRVLRIDPKTGEIEVLASGLAWPSGICLARDGRFLVVSEAWTHSLLRLPEHFTVVRGNFCIRAGFEGCFKNLQRLGLVDIRKRMVIFLIPFVMMYLWHRL